MERDGQRREGAVTLFVFDGAKWSVGRDWSESSTWSWVPKTPGVYSLQVWSRGANSVAASDAWASSNVFTVASPASIGVTNVSLSPMSPLFVGGPAQLTAFVAGGTGPYTYKSFVFDGSTWSLVHDWSASNTVEWTPPAAGTYSFQVWVRGTGSTASWDAWSAAGPATVYP